LVKEILNRTFVFSDPIYNDHFYPDFFKKEKLANKITSYSENIGEKRKSTKFGMAIIQVRDASWVYVSR